MAQLCSCSLGPSADSRLEWMQVPEQPEAGLGLQTGGSGVWVLRACCMSRGTGKGVSRGRWVGEELGGTLGAGRTCESIASGCGLSPADPDRQMYDNNDMEQDYQATTLYFSFLSLPVCLFRASSIMKTRPWSSLHNLSEAGHCRLNGQALLIRWALVKGQELHGKSRGGF